MNKQWTESIEWDSGYSGERKRSLAQVENLDPSTGKIIPICNGANEGACTKAEDVVVKRIRRDHKRAEPGDPDWGDQETADVARAAEWGR